MEKILKKYRAELKSIIRPTLNICIVFGAIFFIAIFISDHFVFNEKMLEATLTLEAVLIPFIAILLTIFTLVYKITLFSDGISSYDPWGNMKCDFMQYSDMYHVQKKSVFGYKYYFICSEDSSKTLWIPINIKNKDNFTRKLSTIIGQDHKLIKEIGNTNA